MLIILSAFQTEYSSKANLSFL